MDRQTDRPTNLVLEAPCRSLKIDSFLFEKIDQNIILRLVAFKLRQVVFKLRQVVFKLRQVAFKLRQDAFIS